MPLHLLPNPGDVQRNFNSELDVDEEDFTSNELLEKYHVLQQPLGV